MLLLEREIFYTEKGFMTKLEKYYNKFKEDHRLTTRHGIVEFSVSMHFIHKYLEELKNAEKKENSQIKIVDVGAGTGRYSVALSREGYDVTAVELVQHNLDVLMSKHEKVKCWPGDARDLSFLPDETFDMVILFGPMYHLHKIEDKLKVLEEAKRISKPNGIILVGYVMNEYAILSYCFKEKKILECVEKNTLTEDFHTITTDDNDLYSYIRIEDINELDEKSDLKRIKIFAPDGAADYMRRELNALSEEEFQKFIEYQMAICERFELLGASSHVVDVLKKK